MGPLSQRTLLRKLSGVSGLALGSIVYADPALPPAASNFRPCNGGTVSIANPASFPYKVAVNGSAGFTLKQTGAAGTAVAPIKTVVFAGKYFRVGAGLFQSSTDLVTWTNLFPAVNTALSTITANAILDLVVVGGKLLACGYGATNPNPHFVVSTTDGTTFTKCWSAAYGGNGATANTAIPYYGSVCGFGYDGSSTVILVMSGSDNNGTNTSGVIRSTDAGVSFSTSTMGYLNQSDGGYVPYLGGRFMVTYLAGVFIIAGVYYTNVSAGNYLPISYYSSTGLPNFTRGNLNFTTGAATTQIFMMAAVNNEIILYDSDSRYYRTTDGKNWVNYGAPTGFVSFVPNYAVSIGGVLYFAGRVSNVPKIYTANDNSLAGLAQAPFLPLRQTTSDANNGLEHLGSNLIHYQPNGSSLDVNVAPMLSNAFTLPNISTLLSASGNKNLQAYMRVA